MKTTFLGKNLNYLPSCHSTNDIAAHKVRSSIAEHGELFITSEQTAGRGQRGNIWTTEAGLNFTFSLVLMPQEFPVSDQFYLSKAIALGLLSYIRTHIPEDVMIKWPNDVMVGRRKIAGILIENSLRGKLIPASVAGIGLNVNQTIFEHSRATSVKLETGRTLELAEELESVLWHIEQYYLILEKGQYPKLDELYLNALLGLNEEREFIDSSTGLAFKGTITGVANDGRLQVRARGEDRHFDIKDIVWIW